jgi:flagellar hook-length control protein FliK
VVSPQGASDAVFGGPQETAPTEGLAATEADALGGAETADAGAGDLQRESAGARTARIAGERASATAPGADAVVELETPRPAQAPSAEPTPQVKHGAETALLDALGEARAERAERMLGFEQGAEVLKQVRLHLAPGLREATLHLQPAWLGRVTVKIAVRAGRARAELRAERVEALEALERHLPELRAALAERGFEDAELDLGLGLAGKAAEARASLTPAGRPMALALSTSSAGAPGELVLPLVPRSARAVDTYA